MNKPTVSIIMPAYNHERYVSSTIESILKQSYADFEFIIIDDCSQDNTAKIIASFSDPRIKVIRNNKNLGITKSLNIGLDAAQGEFIARMDADDVSLPNRLERQVNFFKNNQDIGVLGTGIELVNENGKTKGTKYFPKNHEMIKWKCFFGFPLAHPTVMVRAKILKQHKYNEEFINSQDFELWSRLIFEYDIKFASLPEILLKYRLHPDAASAQKSEDKKKKSIGVIIRNIERYLPLTASEKAIIENNRLQRISLGSFKQEINIYKRLVQAYGKTKEITRFNKQHNIFLFKEYLKQFIN